MKAPFFKAVSLTVSASMFCSCASDISLNVNTARFKRRLFGPVGALAWSAATGDALYAYPKKIASTDRCSGPTPTGNTQYLEPVASAKADAVPKPAAARAESAPAEEPKTNRDANGTEYLAM